MAAMINAEVPDEVGQARDRRRGSAVRALLTRDGERALHAELRRLRNHLGAFSDRLREARGFGEIHENDDYLQIKEEEAVLASRIHQLEALLESATVVDETRSERGAVSIGSIVGLKSLPSGEVREHRLTGGYERMQANEISANSPIGQALLGRRRGDELTVELPGERSAALQIVAVRWPGRS